MRRIFVVLAKLIGLLQINWGLTYLSSVGQYISQIGQMESSQSGEMTVLLGGIFGYALVSFGMAWLFLARTEWIADKLGIETDEQLPSLSDDVVLRAGIKVVGVYILANAIPDLVKSVLEASAYGLFDGRLAVIWTEIVPSVLQVAIALILAIRTDRVLNLLAKGEKADGRRIIIGVLVLLAILIFLGRGLAIHPWFQHRTNYSSSQDDLSYSSGNGDVSVMKDTNTPAARDWYTVPYAQPITNDLSVFTNSSDR